MPPRIVEWIRDVIETEMRALESLLSTDFAAIESVVFRIIRETLIYSLNAASATFALNSELNTRRVRRAYDLLIITSRQGLSRLGKKPSMALIEPVQSCRATSLLGQLSLRI